jgi:hypothetical protein
MYRNAPPFDGGQFFALQKQAFPILQFGFGL